MGPAASARPPALKLARWECLRSFFDRLCPDTAPPLERVCLAAMAGGHGFRYISQKGGKWRAYLSVGVGKQHNGGRHATPEAAAHAADW